MTLPEQGGFNEKLDEILDNFLDGTEARLTEIGWERYGENVAEAKAAIHTLVLEELESKAERLFEWDGGQYEPVEAVPLSVIKKLGGSDGTK